ncbi:MAG: TonB family protein [Candidatus Sulfotelmatobacter sp.]
MNTRTALARPQASSTSKQNLRLLTALALLLVALVVVIVKDSDFWFGSDAEVESDAAPQSLPQTNSTAAPAKASHAAVASVATTRKHFAGKTSTKLTATEPREPKVAESDSPVVATNRAVLPGLDVEVVAGDTHRMVHPGSDVTRVEIPGDPNRIPAVTASMAGLPADAAERARLSSEIAPELRRTVEATYPLLGQHMRVQGSVVLQAVIATDGTIEDLRVLSGPGILTAAAQQAVRQWRFKPYLQNGHPVETTARITVNFSIRISDNSAKAS